MTVQPFNVSEGLNSVETRISVMFITAIKYVSEGLNSVETIHKLYG